MVSERISDFMGVLQVSLYMGAVLFTCVESSLTGILCGCAVLLADCVVEFSLLFSGLGDSSPVVRK